MFGLVTRILARKSRPVSRPAPLRRRLKSRLQVEELMARVLPNASPLSVVSGDLVIHGTRGNDLVSVSVDHHHHGKLDVSVNHHNYQVNARAIHGIVFMENGGHDRLINKTSMVAQLDSGSGQDDDQNGPGQNGELQATLSSTTTPGATGKAEFNSDGELDIHVQGEAANSTLNVLVDGNQVGTLTTDANGNGELELSQAGLVKNGSTIAVGDLNGTFAPPPSDNGEGDDDQGDGHDCGNGASLQATLSNATGATGKAEVNSDGEMHIEIMGAAASSTLNVMVDGNQVGTLTTDANGNGEVELSVSGAKVGSMITVGDLTGTFAAPAPEVHLSAQLTGTGSGEAKFESEDNELHVEISGAAANTTYNISIDGTVVGQLTTDDSGEAEFRTSGGTLTVKDGSTITIADTAGNPPILTGTFAAQVHLSAQLTGTGSGEAKFDSEGNELRVEISGAAANTTYNITIDGTVVGQLTTDDSGEAEFHVSGGTLTVKDGSTISIGDTLGNPPILTGTFSTSSNSCGGHDDGGHDD
jgi:hypothetical protein